MDATISPHKPPRPCQDCGQAKPLKVWGAGTLPVCYDCYRARSRDRIGREAGRSQAAVSRGKGIQRLKTGEPVPPDWATDPLPAPSPDFTPSRHTRSPLPLHSSSGHTPPDPVSVTTGRTTKPLVIAPPPPPFATMEPALNAQDVEAIAQQVCERLVPRLVDGALADLAVPAVRAAVRTLLHQLVDLTLDTWIAHT